MDLGDQFRKSVAEKKQEADREMQRKMDRFASSHKGQDVETIKTDLSRFWSRATGQRLTATQLQQTAQAIHNGERIPTRSRIR